MLKQALIIIIFTTLLNIQPLSAETITTLSGNVYKGKIVSVTDEHYEIEALDGIMIINKDKIKSIQFEKQEKTDKNKTSEPSSIKKPVQHKTTSIKKFLPPVLKELKPLEKEANSSSVESFKLNHDGTPAPQMIIDTRTLKQEQESLKTEKHRIFSKKDYSKYMKKVQKKIKKNWKPYRNKRNLKCIVFFRVDKNGKLINYSMQTPSENERFNKAAIKAIEKSQPFDPIPPDFPDETLDISFSFDIQ